MRAIAADRFSTLKNLACEPDLGPALDSVSAAMFLLDFKGKPLHLNAAAGRMMRFDRVLSLDQFGVLKAERQQDKIRLARLIIDRDGQVTNVARLLAHDGRRAFVAWSVLVPAAEIEVSDQASRVDETFIREARVLLLIVPTDRTCVIPAEAIERGFGLTVTESRLVAALVRGASLNEHASAAGVSAKTARNQLASVFGKCGVARQSELVAMVLRTMSMFGKSDVDL